MATRGAGTRRGTRSSAGSLSVSTLAAEDTDLAPRRAERLDALAAAISEQVLAHPAAWAVKRAVREEVTRPRLAAMDPAKAIRVALEKGQMSVGAGNEAWAGLPVPSSSSGAGASGGGSSTTTPGKGASSGSGGGGGRSSRGSGRGNTSARDRSGSEGTADDAGVPDATIGLSTVIRNLVAQRVATGPAPSGGEAAEAEALALPAASLAPRFGEAAAGTSLLAAGAAAASRNEARSGGGGGGGGGDSSARAAPTSAWDTGARRYSGGAASGSATGADADVPPLPQPPEALDVIAQARADWSRQLASRLNASTAKLGRPIEQPREEELDEFLESLGAHNAAAAAAAAAASAAGAAGAGSDADDADGDGSAAPRTIPSLATYTSTDLLKQLSSIPCPNYAAPRAGMRGWGLIKVQLQVPDVSLLREYFADLSPEYRQIGLDDLLRGCEWFGDRRSRLAVRALEHGYVPLLRQYCKRGCPASQRSAVWAACLGARTDARAAREVQDLVDDVFKRDLITDEMVQHDVRVSCDDDRYFPFVDTLRAIGLAFTRDPWVARESACMPHMPVVGVDDSGKPTGMVPPCGVLPSEGQTAYAAPLTYLHQDRDPVYFMYRAMWGRYWCKLNTISSDAGTLLPLCRLFETLVQRYVPEACFHLLQLGVAPLTIAFPWIRLAFTHYLETDQVLLLWDRIVGFERLELLSVLAAAIFVFRSASLLRTVDANGVREIFGEATKLKVVPLLQYFLFAGKPV